MTEYDRLVEQGRRKGLRQGRIQGMERGRVQGVAEVLLDQMEARVGPVPDDVKARVQAASFAELKAWALRALTATTLADVFDTPTAPPPDPQQPAPRAPRQSPSPPHRTTRPRR